VNPRIPNRNILLAAVTALALGLCACGSEAPGGSQEPGLDAATAEQPDAASAGLDAGQPDSGLPEADGGAPPPERRMTAVGDSERSVVVGGAIDLEVLVEEEGETVEPVKNVEVSFALSGDNPGGANLAATTATTNALGIAKVTLNAGTEITEGLKVTATAADLPSVEFTVGVRERFLAVVGASNLDVGVMEQPTTLTVVLKDYQGQALAGSDVRFAILTADHGGASLSDTNAIKTDGAGLAKVDFTPGQNARRSVVVEASSDGAATALFNVNVRARVLEVVGSPTFSAYTREEKQLKVDLYDFRGDRLVNEAVQFRIVGANPGSAVLGATSVQTDALGRALTTLRTGTRPASVKVEASALGAVAQTFTVDVVAWPPGALRVNVQYANADWMGVQSVDVSMCTDETGGCACPGTQAGYENLSPTVWTRKESKLTTSLPFEFAEIPADSLVHAVAVIRGPRGVVLATGCSEQKTIESNVTASAAIAVTERPQNLLGTYSNGAKLHLAQALPEPYGSVLAEIDKALRNTGEWFADWLFAQLQKQDWYNSIPLIDLFAQGIKPAIVSAINEYLLPLLPPQFQGGITIVGDLIGALTNLEIATELEIKTITGDALTGTERWTRFLVHWGYGCDPTDACCEYIEIDPSDIGQGIIEANVTGRIETRMEVRARRYTIALDTHTTQVEFGMLTLHMLNNYVFPPIPSVGAPNLAGVLNNLVKCPQLATNICTKPIYDSNGDGEKDWTLQTLLGENCNTYLGNACTAAIGLGVQYVENKLLELKNDSNFETAARLILEDTDLDLNTDSITNGTLTGTIVGKDEQGNPTGTPVAFSGNFEGHVRRTACQADRECLQATTVCRPYQDVMNPCRLTLGCDVQAGELGLGDSCTDDGLCKSGICQDDKCFVACSTAADCSSEGMSCAQDAVIDFLGGFSATTSMCK